MKSIFEEMGGTYRQERDYLLPNLSMPLDAEDYQIGKWFHQGSIDNITVDRYDLCKGR